MEKITAEEFIDKVDRLCFEHKFEISIESDPFERAVILVEGDRSEARVYYIDGDGRGK